MTTQPLPAHLDMLRRLVDASGWHTNDTGLMQAVPHMVQNLSAADCVTALRNLGLPLDFVSGKTTSLTQDDLPTLKINRHGGVQIILERDGDQILCEDTLDGGTARWVKATPEIATFVRIGPHQETGHSTGPNGVAAIARQFRGTWVALFFASFVTNIMALATPLLIMVIYDRAIPTGATELILSLGIAMVIILLTDLVLRMIRSVAVAHMGAAMEGRLSLALFRKLAAIPLAEIQKSDVDQQIARLRQFEGMRDLFAGPVFTTLLDIPFIFLFFGLLFFISPAIGLLMVGATLCFAIAAWVTAGPLARRNAEAAKARTAYQKLLFETIQSQRTVQRLGLQDLWRRRHARLAATNAEASRSARQFQLSCQAFGQSLMAVSGILAVFLGTELAILGGLSFGALVAIMSLVWKSLAPVHALYTNMPQIQGFLSSRRQIDRVLGLPEEFLRGAAQSDFKAFKGQVTLSAVSHRFSRAPEPALTQITLDIPAGELVVIAGPNGGGKTTLLDMIDGLLAPLGGTLHFDGVNARQIAVDDLRHMISYARQQPEFFHGTVWQNFQMASPGVDRETAEATLSRLGLDADIAHFPEGIDTRLSEAFRKTLSSSTLRGLALARSLCRPATIFLLDCPANGLDAPRRTALNAYLADLKGHHTVIIVSDDPDHLRMADRIVFLEKGRIVINDAGDAGRRKLAALRSRNRMPNHD